MITVENVSVVVSKDSYQRNAEDPQMFMLNASIKSDSLEFLNRVAKAIHRELSTPGGYDEPKFPIHQRANE